MAFALMASIHITFVYVTLCFPKREVIFEKYTEIMKFFQNKLNQVISDLITHRFDLFCTCLQCTYYFHSYSKKKKKNTLKILLSWGKKKKKNHSIVIHKVPYPEDKNVVETISI